MEAKVRKQIYLTHKADTMLWELFKVYKEKGEHKSYSSIIEEAIKEYYSKKE